MGGCSSYFDQGKQAVRRSQQHQPQYQRTTTNMNGARNDAVLFFYRTNGLQPTFTQFELSLSASNLLDRDILSKCDPMVVVYAKKQDGRLEELGRTEVIVKCRNPEWIEKIPVAFQFEVVQTLEFHVYVVDTKYHGVPTKTIKLRDEDFLGEGSCTLSEIVTKHSKSLTLRLQYNSRHGSSRDLGSLTVHAVHIAASKIAVDMDLRCSNLDKKGIFSKTDPFLRISRLLESGDSIPIFKTEVIKNNLNPTWKLVSLSSHQFVSKDNLLLIECFDFNSSGNHVLIGELRTSIASLEIHHRERMGSNLFMPFTLNSAPRKILKGQLFVDQYSEMEQFCFIDYISNGFKLKFVVAIDFTSSNESSQSPDSLHYIDPSGQLNSYHKAIMEVGEVIQFYDFDRQFPAWGFGGNLLDGTVSHCFNLNGSPSSSEVVGVEGIMDAYASSLHNVTLSGPTLFGPVINKAAQMASESLSLHNSTKYYVLLIITDGVVMDLPETIDALVNASDFPLSVLIVGVGNADFTSMEQVLDGRLESSAGRVATRDIVQFVPLKEVQNEQISVVQALLKKLPDQFLAFMRMWDIKPLL